MSCSDIVKTKVIKISLEDGKILTVDMKELHIKQASTYHTQNYLYAEAVNSNQEEKPSKMTTNKVRKSYQTLCTQKENSHRNSRNSRQLPVSRNVNPNRNPSSQGRVNQNWQTTPKCPTTSHNRNSLDRYGMTTNCNLINHYSQNC